MNGVAQLTYLALGLAVFGQQLCLPFPSMLLLMTAGAVAVRGEGHLTIPLVLLTSVVACVAADSDRDIRGSRLELVDEVGSRGNEVADGNVDHHCEEDPRVRKRSRN